MSFRNATKKLVGPYIQAAGKQAEAAAATSHQRPDVIDQEASKSTERADTENEKRVDAFSHDVCKSISSASVKSLEHKETLNQKVVGAVGSTAIQAKEWVTEHPYQTVGIAVGVAAVPISIACTPLALATAGFGAAGVQGGSIAATVQAGIGNVAAGSVFATLQSAGASGAGLAVVNGVAGGVTAASAVGANALGYLWGRRGKHEPK